MQADGRGLGEGIAVFDGRGEVFRLLRSQIVDVPILRVFGSSASAASNAAALRSGELSIVAVYGESDWRFVHEVVGNVHVVVVAAQPSPGDAARALAAGAFGYLSLQMPAPALRRALLGALQGEPAYSRIMLGELIRMRMPLTLSHEGKALSLTPRQREVLALIAQGAADKEIGLTLRIATGTAQKHVTNLLRKLGVPNRAAAVAASYVAPALAPSAVAVADAASSLAYSSRLRSSDEWSVPSAAS